MNRAGIATGILVAPLMPGINDAPEQLEPLLEAAVAAGARSIGGVALHLRGEVRELFMQWLRDQRPELLERYEELYRRGAYAPPEERKRLTALVRDGTAGRLKPRDRGPSRRSEERPDSGERPGRHDQDRVLGTPGDISRAAHRPGAARGQIGERTATARSEGETGAHQERLF